MIGLKTLLNDEKGKTLVDKALRRMVMLERQAADGRDPNTTMVIVDSKTVDNADTPNEKDMTVGKKCQE